MNSVTIYAPASAQGRAGVAVIRVSGPDAQRVFALCRPGDIPAPRHATLRHILQPNTGETIDHALLLFFPAPHSFTGEDVVELHIHGGRAVMHGVLQCLQTLPGYRLAEAGEFSRRAFENGKLDLTEAEAIADLVDAETDAQRRQALRQMQGALGRLYEDWRARLTAALAYLEASIDFADEDLPADMVTRKKADIAKLADSIAGHLDDGHRGERVRDGFAIAIVGAPNAGKSSLLNHLARRDAAIVSSIAGTTRDVIEVQLDLGGYPVTIADTAGLRDSVDAIESEGIRRAKAKAEQADLKLLVFDGAAWPARDPATLALGDAKAITVINKSDLLDDKRSGDANGFFVSAKTGAGIDVLLAALVTRLDAHASADTAPPLTRQRHRAALEECLDHLRRAIAAPQLELCAEDLRLATRALGRITGRVDVEDLLNVIFRDFCIGK
jgi:tRNA modification GTPase